MRTFINRICADGRLRVIWGAAAAALIFAGCEEKGDGCDGQSGGGYAGGYGEVVHDADGQVYKTVQIGGQVWMAENLNYRGAEPDTIGKCYNNSADNCAKYGRLYSWAAAMGLDTSYNGRSAFGQIQTPRQGICPDGWHIPTREEWDVLTAAVGGGATAGKHLKSVAGWSDCGVCGSGNPYLCWDTRGFAAAPGGYYGASSREFYDAGYRGRWWSADEGGAGSNAYYRYMYNVSERAEWKSDNTKSYLYSVRCVQTSP